MRFSGLVRLIFLMVWVAFSVSAFASDQEATPPHQTETGAMHSDESGKHEKVHSDAAAHPGAVDEHEKDHDDVEHGHGHINLGEVLPLWSCIPFACMLLSIALFPLLASEFWHHNFGKVSAFWAIALGLPFLIAYKGTALHDILHIIPFFITIDIGRADHHL